MLSNIIDILLFISADIDPFEVSLDGGLNLLIADDVGVPQSTIWK
jgi:hypothetical protein